MTPAMWYFMFLIFISFNTKRLFANGNSGLDLGQPKKLIRERGGGSRVMEHINVLHVFTLVSKKDH
jgi:hypothetical protein